MSKKFISILLSVMMVLSVFTGFGTIVRAEERNEYIINVDVEKLAPGFEKAYTTQNYDLALKLSDEALDKFEEVLKTELPNVEVFDRIELLVPALVAKMNAEELERAKSLPNVLEVFENYIINESDITRSNMAVFQDRGVDSVLGACSRALMLPPFYAMCGVGELWMRRFGTFECDSPDSQCR